MTLTPEEMQKMNLWMMFDSELNTETYRLMKKHNLTENEAGKQAWNKLQPMYIKAIAELEAKQKEKEV